MIDYCNAGHNLLYILRKDDTIEQVQNTEGLLGKIEPMEYKPKQIQLEPGKKIVLYTDGVPEAMNENGEMHEEERLENYLTAHPSDSQEKLLHGIIVNTLKFVTKAHLSDDNTLLVPEYQGSE